MTLAAGELMVSGVERIVDACPPVVIPESIRLAVGHLRRHAVSIGILAAQTVAAACCRVVSGWNGIIEEAGIPIRLTRVPFAAAVAGIQQSSAGVTNCHTENIRCVYPGAPDRRIRMTVAPQPVGARRTVLVQRIDIAAVAQRAQPRVVRQTPGRCCIGGMRWHPSGRRIAVVLVDLVAAQLNRLRAAARDSPETIVLRPGIAGLGRAVFTVGIPHPAASQVRRPDLRVPRCSIEIVHIMTVAAPDSSQIVDTGTTGRTDSSGDGRGMGRLDRSGLVGKFQHGGFPPGADPIPLQLQGGRIDQPAVVVIGRRRVGIGIRSPLGVYLPVVVVTVPADFRFGRASGRRPTERDAVVVAGCRVVDPDRGIVRDDYRP